MTLIVGIIAKDGIVMASDSQTSDIGDIKMYGANKLRTVNFRGREVLIGIRGIVPSGLQVIHYMEEESKRRKITNQRSVTDVAKLAMMLYRKETVQFYAQQFMKDEWDRHFESLSHRFDLMIGHWYNKRPLLYTVPIATGDATPHQVFAVIGSGQKIAQPILARRHLRDISWQAAVLVAMQAIQSATEHGGDIYCGGQSCVAILRPNDKNAVFLDDTTLETMADQIKKQSENRERDFIAAMESIALRNKSQFNDAIKSA